MKLRLIKRTSCNDCLIDFSKNGFQIELSTMMDGILIEQFFRNNSENASSINLEKTFIIYLPEEYGKKDKIIGAFSFENNHIPTKFFFDVSEEEKERDDRNFIEITNIIIDKQLIDMIVLQECFSIILPQLVVNTPVDEVVWCDYKGNLWAKVINAFVKQDNIEYSYANEAYYFADKIVKTLQFEQEYENHIKDLMIKAGK